MTPPRRFGSYHLLTELGRGGMGAVFLARHVELGREVAIKVLLGDAGPSEEARFRREAAAAASLNHPGIVRVHDFGREQGTLYLVLERVEGESLAARLARQGPLAPREAAALVVEVADAVAAAHAQGVIHRDLKPHNVLMQGARPRLTDFGIAQVEQASRLTRTGQALGTPAYMAPEQVEGKEVDARADVYGLGAILYEALTGRAPFSGTTEINVITKLLREPPPTPSTIRPGLDRGLEAICLRCLEKEPGARYPEVGALRSDLTGWLAGDGASGARAVAGKGRVAVALAAAVGAGALAAVGGLGGAWGGSPAAAEAGAAETPVVAASEAPRATPLPDRWTVQPSPFSARRAANMVYDGARGELFLYGGRIAERPGYSEELWLRKDGEWRRVPLPAGARPQKQWLAAVAYDEARERVVLLTRAFAITVTWTWDGERFEAHRLERLPPHREQGALVYDGARQEAVLFGGLFAPPREPDVLRGDTWSWDGATWTEREVEGPSPRYAHGMAYDPLRREVVLFGGKDRQGPRRDTWAWDGRRWEQRRPAQAPPAREVLEGMVWDPRHEAVVLLGGRGAEGELLTDMWSWDGADWRALPTSVPPGFQRAAAYDPSEGAIVVAGGFRYVAKRQELLAEVGDY